MRQSKFFLLIAIAILLTPACEKDDSNPSSAATNSGGGNGNGGNNNPTGYYLTADLDRQATTFTVFPGNIDSTTIFLGGIGPNNGYPQMIISVPVDATPQTYNYPINFNDTAQKSVNISYALNDSIFYLANKGSFVLSKHDTSSKIIEATFNVSMYEFVINDPDSVVVTNGQLRLTYN